jgi:N utilization substance protein B
MGARSKARRQALELLFEAESRNLDASELVQDRIANPVSDTPIRPYAIEIISGVTKNRERLDELLSTYSAGWQLSRMPIIDRQMLRLAVWEMLYNDDVPDAVAIAEAVNLVSELSTDNSPNFVSGLLNRIKDLSPSLIE